MFDLTVMLSMVLVVFGSGYLFYFLRIPELLDWLRCQFVYSTIPREALTEAIRKGYYKVLNETISVQLEDEYYIISYNTHVGLVCTRVSDDHPTTLKLKKKDKKFLMDFHASMFKKEEDLDI